LALVVFNGTVMRGQPQHANLAEASFVCEVRTAPVYRLFSIGDRYPAMIRDDENGARIEAELYEVADDAWPRIRDSEPPGLYRGPVVLDDGREVEGMLGDRVFLETAESSEITRFGGWRSYLDRR
jgi:gamma-glutamylcyclotransferase (GGCT)/AIG2-like uncharacterized protein YtfP